jgi:putative ABC transport system permease protein
LFLPLGAAPTRYSVALLRMQPNVAPDFVQLRQRIEERLGPVRLTLTYLPARFDRVLEDPRFRAVLFIVLAMSALVLSAVGLYAVSSFEVRQREYEMGVRLSLGATAGDINRLVLNRACRPVLIGLAFGFIGAYWAAQFIQRFLYQVEARDPWMYLPVAGLLLAAALLAAWLPARRAGGLDPAIVLRSH